MLLWKVVILFCAMTCIAVISLSLPAEPGPAKWCLNCKPAMVTVRPKQCCPAKYAANYSWNYCFRKVFVLPFFGGREHCLTRIRKQDSIPGLFSQHLPWIWAKPQSQLNFPRPPVCFIMLGYWEEPLQLLEKETLLPFNSFLPYGSHLLRHLFRCF